MSEDADKDPATEAGPNTLKPVPVVIWPLTPKPPVILTAPDVELVDCVLSATNIALANNVFPIYEVPAMPTPLDTTNPPVEVDVERVEDTKEITPLKVLFPAKV